MILPIAIRILSSAIMSLAFQKFMEALYQKRRTSKKFMVISFVAVIGLSVPTFELLGDVSSITLLLMLIQIIAICVLSLNFKSTIVKRIVTIVCLHLLFFLSGLLVVFIVDILHDTWSFDKMSVSIFFTSLTMYLSASFLRRFKNISKSSIKFPMFWVFVSVLPIMVILVFAFALLDLPNDFVGVFFMTMLIGFFFLSFYLYDTLIGKYEEKVMSTKYALEREFYLSQCQLMQDSVEKMKLYRHDVKLHLTTLKDFTTDNKAATDYLNSLLGEIGEKEIYSDTGNIAFDSIINFKLKTAVEDNVKVDIDVLVPPSLNVEVVDVVTILGNLLDNALDAVAKIEEKIINLNIEASKGNLFIKLDNTFDGEVKYAKGKDGAEKNIVSRKNGDNHGYGLKNIRKSAEKYNGHVDISHEGNIFSVGVLLYVDKV